MRVFQNQTVVFYGNSLNRQLFTRIIHILRDWRTVYEHYFHRHAKYTHNGTHDHFVSYDDLADEPPTTLVNVQLTLRFVWAKSANLQSTLRVLHPTILIGNNWNLVDMFDVEGNKNIAHSWLPDQLLPYAAELQHVFLQDVTPRTEKPYSEPETAILLVNRHIEDLRDLLRKQHIPATVLASEPLYRYGSYQKNSVRFEVPPLHWQCSFMPMEPQAPTGFKHPDNGDCTDRMNKMLVKSIVEALTA
jgi:hypothetical protein